LFKNLLQQPAFDVTAMHGHRGPMTPGWMLQRQMTTALFQFDKTRTFERADEFEGIDLR